MFNFRGIFPGLKPSIRPKNTRKRVSGGEGENIRREDLNNLSKKLNIRELDARRLGADEKATGELPVETTELEPAGGGRQVSGEGFGERC